MYRRSPVYWAQKPRMMQATDLQLADGDPTTNQPPWATISAPYVIRRSKAPWQQKPLRLQATDLQLGDGDPTTNQAPWADAFAPWAIRKGRQQWQQLPSIDLDGLGLQLSDQDITLQPLPEYGSSTYQRWRGRVWNQWPVYSRVDATGLELADQDVTLQPSLTAPDAPYLIRKSRASWQQWPVFGRIQATDLQLADQDVNLRPIIPPTTDRRRQPPWVWYNPEPSTLTPALPDQDINLVPVTLQLAVRRRQPSWVWYNPDPATLTPSLPDQDINLVPVILQPTVRRRQPAWVWYNPDPASLPLPDQDVSLVPPWAALSAPYVLRRSRVAFQQAGPLPVPDQDVNLLPPWAMLTTPYVIRRSRVAFQQAAYFDLDSLGLQLPDQDVNLVPVLMQPTDRRRQPAWIWNNPDPVTLIPPLPDQDVNLAPPWALGSAVYAIRKGRPWFQQKPLRYEDDTLSTFNLGLPERGEGAPGGRVWRQRHVPELFWPRPRQQWQQYEPTDPTGIPLPDQDINLVPIPAQLLGLLPRRSSRAEWQQFEPTDPSVIPLADQDIDLVPVPAQLLGQLARRSSRAGWQQYDPYPDVLGLQLADADVRLQPWGAPTFLSIRKSRASWQQATYWQILLLANPFYTGGPHDTGRERFTLLAIERYTDGSRERYTHTAEDGS